MAIAGKLFAAMTLAAGVAAAAPVGAATGLNGAYYRTGAPGSVANAEGLILGKTPDATFLANTVCFPTVCADSASDGTSLSAFLGANATGLSADFTQIDGHVLTLTGFLNLPTTGGYTFRLGSDDGSSLTIDGVSLLNDGDHGYGEVAGTYTLTAGFHSIRILQFEDGGVTSLAVFMNGTALGGSILSTTGAVGAVPEPATWAMMLTGFGLLGASARRRRAIGARSA